jgi:hypothetical protein
MEPAALWQTERGQDYKLVHETFSGKKSNSNNFTIKDNSL